MIVERIMKNGNDPVLEFGLQDGFSVFQSLKFKRYVAYRISVWRPGRHTQKQTLHEYRS